MYKQLEKSKKSKSRVVPDSVVQMKTDSGNRSDIDKNQNSSFNNRADLPLQRSVEGESIGEASRSRYGRKLINDDRWAFSIGRKGGGDGHAALIIEGWHNHGHWQEHWAQMAHWVPQKINGNEADEQQMKSGEIEGRVIEKWEGVMVGIKERNENKSYEQLSAFRDFDQYKDVSTHLIGAENGQSAQRQINSDKITPPKFQFYGIGDNKYNCASWVARIGKKAKLSLPTEDKLCFLSLFTDVKFGTIVHRPSTLVEESKYKTANKSTQT